MNKSQGTRNKGQGCQRQFIRENLYIPPKAAECVQLLLVNKGKPLNKKKKFDLSISFRAAFTFKYLSSYIYIIILLIRIL